MLSWGFPELQIYSENVATICKCRLFYDINHSIPRSDIPFSDLKQKNGFLAGESPLHQGVL
jgi:hypothetical protein